MKNLFKSKAATAIIIVMTILLAGVAIFTAIRLYQLRQESVAPTVPSESSAFESTPVSCETVAFTITVEEPSVTPTASLTPTVSPTASPTVTPTDRPLGGTSPTPTNTPSNTPTPTTGGQIAATSPTPGGSTLPDAGVALPTLLGMALGMLIIFGAVLLVL